jgi:hypothetical protein
VYEALSYSVLFATSCAQILAALGRAGFGLFDVCVCVCVDLVNLTCVCVCMFVCVLCVCVRARTA